MKILKVSLIIILFLVGASAAILYGFYRYNDKEKLELSDAIRQHTKGSFVKLSQGITHYQLGGPDSGQVVVLLHGFSVPYYIWNGTYDYLVKEGYRVLRYDMYGRGYSDRPDIIYNNTLFNNQLIELLNQLKIHRPIIIAGVSFGGEVATDFTCTHPELVKKVILVDPGYSLDTPGAPESYVKFVEAVNSNDRANGQLDDFKYPERHPNWVKRYLNQMQYKGFRHALVSTMFNFDFPGRQKNICLNNARKPVLLIWGKEDKTVPFRYSDSIRSVLKADFFPVTDAAHLPFIEKADTVNFKILSFLKEG